MTQRRFVRTRARPLANRQWIRLPWLQTGEQLRQFLSAKKSVRVAPVSFPSLACRSIFWAVLTTTSTTSPSATRLVMASVPDQEMTTVCPVAFSNTEIASETDSLAAFGAKTLSSAAMTEKARPNEVSRQVAIRASMFCPPMLMSAVCEGAQINRVLTAKCP